MKDKIFKAIKCFLFMLPFVFVGGKTLYTILNENAKDSYTSSNMLYSYSVVGSVIDYPQGAILDFRYERQVEGYTPLYPFSSTSLDLNALFGDLNVTHLGCYSNETYSYLAYQVNNDGTNRLLFDFTSDFSLVLDTSIYSIKQVNSFLSNYVIYMGTYVPQKLDNAFEFGLTEFNNIGFGKIDFLEWFNNMFLNNNFNNVYSTFINSYLNYFLFVELVIFIPSVFHWVIHFFTEIGNNVISKSTDKKKGD